MAEQSSGCPGNTNVNTPKRVDKTGWQRKLIGNNHHLSTSLQEWASHPLMSSVSSLQHLWPQDLHWQAGPRDQVFWILLVSLDQTGE